MFGNVEQAPDRPAALDWQERPHMRLPPEHNPQHQKEHGEYFNNHDSDVDDLDRPCYLAFLRQYVRMQSAHILAPQNNSFHFRLSQC